MKVTYYCKIFNSQPLIQLMERYKNVVNFASEQHFGHKNSIIQLHSKVYKRARELFSCPSQIIIKAEQECLANYRASKTAKHKIINPIIKHNLSIQLDKRLYSYKQNILKITTLNGRQNFEIQKYPLIESLFKQYKFGDPKLFCKKGGVYISFPFEIPDKLPINDKACGVDLGMRRIATTSEGKIYTDKQYLKNKRKIRFKKRSLQSKNTKSAKRKLNKLKYKEKLQTKDFVHRLSKQLIKSTKSDYIVIEDLSKIKDKKKRGISKYKKINRLSQIPFYMIRQFLTYKAPLYGKQVVTVCPSYTSQIDHRTGLKDGTRKGCRYYCKDGIILDSDINAAINIAIRSKLPVSSCKGLDGQANVTKLNVLIDKPLNLLSG